MQLSGSLNETDWGSVFTNLTNALPNIANTYLGYQAAKTQADAQAKMMKAAMQVPTGYNYPTGYNVSPAYSGTYAYPSAYPGAPAPSGVSTSTMLILGAAGIALLLLLNEGKK